MERQPRKRSHWLVSSMLTAGLLLWALPAAAAPPGFLTARLIDGSFVDAPIRLTLTVQSIYQPSSRVLKADFQDGKIRVELLNPPSTQIVPQYEYVLPIELPPLGIGGNIPVEVYALEAPDDPAPRLVGTPTTLFLVHGVKILEVLPAEPTLDDNIVLRLDQKPGFPAAELALGQDTLRVNLYGAGTSTPDGWNLPIGKLPEGKFRVELLGSLGRNEVQITVVSTESGPPLLAGQFAVSVAWENALGERGEGNLVQPPSQDSALFYFFSPDNWELMVKVLDGCAINGHFWVFGAASTDVGYTIEVNRSGSPQSLRIENPVGTTAPAITNVEAFPCDPNAF